MPFPFSLPTTSTTLLTEHFDSVTHPSLPLAAATRRSVLRDALKRYKRLPLNERAAHLPAIHDAVLDYVPYLLALHSGLSYRDVGPEKIDVQITKPFAVEWRCTLAAAMPGRDPPRPRLVGLHNEIAFTLSTLAYAQSLLARVQLRSLLVPSASPAADQRTSTITAAMKMLLDAHNIHNYLLTLPAVAAATKDTPIDIHPTTIAALGHLALAEATLIVVEKDDPYSVAVADDRNETNTDWMFKAPSIPAVRALLYARICLAAAEHATQAHSLLATSNTASTPARTALPTSSASSSVRRLDDDLVKYVGEFKRTARGKAMRFLGINAKETSKTGEALAWLKCARKELGMSMDSNSDDGKRKGFLGLKQSWAERREDRRVETGKGGEWGRSGGRLEEARIVESLEAKWSRENSLVNFQPVVPWEPLLAKSLPSGRNYHTPTPWTPPELSRDIFMALRAPLDPDEAAYQDQEADSDGDADIGGNANSGDGSAFAPGAFPQSDAESSRPSGAYF